MVPMLLLLLLLLLLPPSAVAVSTCFGQSVMISRQGFGLSCLSQLVETGQHLVVVLQSASSLSSTVRARVLLSSAPLTPLMHVFRRLRCQRCLMLLLSSSQPRLPCSLQRRHRTMKTLVRKLVWVQALVLAPLPFAQSNWTKRL
jgi:hypothetical protein